MLDIGWSELLVIAIVMIVVVGPKDLPKMLRAFGKATARMRATASEFRHQFDEALKEAELEDVKNIIDETRKLDPRTKLTQVFDPIRSAGEDLRSGLQSGTSMSPASMSPAAPEKPAEVTTPVENDGTPVPPPAPAAPAALEPEKAEPRKAAARPKKVAAVPKTAAKAVKPAAPKTAAPKSAAPKAAAPKAAAQKAATKKPVAAKPAAPARKTTRKTGHEA